MDETKFDREEREYFDGEWAKRVYAWLLTTHWCPHPDESVMLVIRQAAAAWVLWNAMSDDSDAYAKLHGHFDPHTQLWRAYMSAYYAEWMELLATAVGMVKLEHIPPWILRDPGDAWQDWVDIAMRVYADVELRERNRRSLTLQDARDDAFLTTPYLYDDDHDGLRAYRKTNWRLGIR